MALTGLHPKSNPILVFNKPAQSIPNPNSNHLYNNLQTQSILNVLILITQQQIMLI
ncbi:18287_t:CDS:2 [Gigaspora margarita]|uniref:18287_t:CDS:1 n=1 Tax=Gigaspora margarita TaxID=4874 RepID=A0ABN7UXZ5_GIGMA|nr:18287_t:CDS:2 [Gigaspora margarita]